jgi:GTP-binding protein Era
VAGAGPEIEGPPELRAAAAAALSAAGIGDGHLTVELVGPERIRELNRSFRDRDEVTDVLAFPVDEAGPSAGPRELGDVVICPEQTYDLEEAVVHGVLHLAGHDHETDDGEMLELQGKVLSRLAGATETRSGFIAVAGRPNVGKSTLVNAIVGTKVAVISDKPQTTRRAIRGVVTGRTESRRWQLVLVDLPGVQRPLDALTERMQTRVEQELAECDGVLFVLSGAERMAGGDRFIAKALAKSSVPVIAAVNKVDVLDKGATLAVLDAAAALEQEGVTFNEIFPISALKGGGIAPLTRALVSMLPPGPLYYPEEVRSDQSKELAIAELIREQALARTRDEVPHSIEVNVDEIERRDSVTAINAVIWVETSSQKGILIGKGGAMIREIGKASRRQIEPLVGDQVYLELSVKVRKSWRRDESMLDRLGV